jgi:hypothetical protein
MNIKNFLKASAITVFTAGCASAASPNYTVSVPLSEDEDDMMVYLVEFDSGDKIDSTMVTNGVAKFQGQITTPAMVTMVLDGTRLGTIALEPGDITVNPQLRKTTGTPINDYINDMNAKSNELQKEFNAISKEDSTYKAKQEEIYGKYLALQDKAFEDNVNNAFGYYLFLQKAYDLDLKGLDEQMKKYPQFANGKRIAKLRQALINKEETSVGHKFKDFSITNDGKTQRLSDYVGKGQYTLVDFWASWCGPCIRETAVIKELYNKYHDKGLNVLGVAVWDEPQNTLQAIEKHSLPWEQILNAQSIPTDIYGISGIPCIILFDPEGNIVSRDKQDEDLVKDVEAAMLKAAAIEN